MNIALILILFLIAIQSLQSQDISHFLSQLNFPCKTRRVLIISLPIDPKDAQQIKDEFSELRSNALSFPEPACIYYLLPQSWAGISDANIMKLLSGTAPLLCEKFKVVKFNKGIIRQTWGKVILWNLESQNITQYVPNNNSKVVIQPIKIVKTFPLKIPIGVKVGRLIAIDDSIGVFLNSKEDELILVNLNTGGIFKKVNLYHIFCKKLYLEFSLSNSCKKEIICHNAIRTYREKSAPKLCKWISSYINSSENTLVLKGICAFCKETIYRRNLIIPQTYWRPIAITYKLPSLQFTDAQPIDSQSIVSQTTSKSKLMITQCMDTTKLTFISTYPKYSHVKVFTHASGINEGNLFIIKKGGTKIFHVGILPLKDIQGTIIHTLITEEKIYILTDKEVVLIGS